MPGSKVALNRVASGVASESVMSFRSVVLVAILAVGLLVAVVVLPTGPVASTIEFVIGAIAVMWFLKWFSWG
jgi:hypothetical protein